MIQQLIVTDPALVSATILMAISVLVSLVASHKHENTRSHFVDPLTDGVTTLMRIGSFMTFLAIIPGTIYIVTRLFPTFAAQLFIGGITITFFATVRNARLVIQMGVTILISLVLTICYLPFYGLWTIAGKLLSGSNSTDTTNQNSP